MDTINRLTSYLTTFGRKYPTAWQHLDNFRQQYKNHPELEWKDTFYCPLEAARTYFGGGSNKSVPPHLADEVPTLLAIGTWRLTQNVYRFDETVLKAVWNMESPGDLPVELLSRLPDWCAYIETPGRRFEQYKLFGFFVLLSKNYDTKNLELIFVLDTEAGFAHLLTFLVEGTLQQSIEAFCDYVLAAGRQDTTGAFPAGVDEEATKANFVSQMSKQLAPFLSLTIFLCSQTGSIPGIESRNQPDYNPKKKRMFPAKGVRVWEVAYRIGAAIREAEEREKIEGSPTGAGESKRPHVRRAHWHGFWSGPRSGEQVFTLKWLPPIPVNVSEETPIVPVIRKIA